MTFAKPDNKIAHKFITFAALKPKSNLTMNRLHVNGGN